MVYTMHMSLVIVLLLGIHEPVHAKPPAAMDQEILRVIDLFYDLRFDAARKAADGLAAKYPGHPVGPFYRSIVSYQRFIAEEARSPETLKAFEKDSAVLLDNICQE